MVSDELALVHALYMPDGQRWSDVAAPFQKEDAAAVLDARPGEPRYHFLTRPRAGSKTTDLAACGLVLTMQFAPWEQGYAVAADGDQAGLLVAAAGGFVLRMPELQKRLRIERRRIVQLDRKGNPTGAALNVLPADGASAYGLLGPLFIADELAQWKSTPEPRRVWEAVISAVPKVPGARLIVLTTAGDPSHWSARVLEHAKSSPRWRVNEVPGPVPWIAAEALEEQRALLTPSQYRRLHLNEWVAPEDRLTTVDGVHACVAHDGVVAARSGARYVIGLDLGVKNDRTVIAVCHADGRGDERRVVLDRMEVFTPTRDRPVDLAVVEEAARTLSRSYGRAHVVMDPWQGLLLARNLRSFGVPVTEFAFSQQSVGRIAMTLYRLIRDRRLALPDDAELLDELAHVRLRETSPGVYRLDHDADRHDDRAIALALAAHELAGQTQGGRARTSARAALRPLGAPRLVGPR